MSSASNTPPENYFNDLSHPTGNGGQNGTLQSPVGGMSGAADGEEGSTVPKPKRIACVICRKRKLKCDGSKPSCSTCTRLGHHCSYDEQRRKSGPKRGYVKALEERLKQVETLLKSQEPAPAPAASEKASFSNRPSNNTTTGLPRTAAADLHASTPCVGIVDGVNTERWRYNDGSQAPMEDLNFPANMNLGLGIDDNTFSWEMIGLGLEEPLPAQDTIDELHQIYFEKIHPSVPMIHRPRYLAAMNLAPNQRPPVALRYAMWTLAASVTEKFMDLKEHFYHRARKYIELDALKGHGEHMISIAHAQAHTLLASYEFKMMYFPRAWMSTGAAIRLCQMMSLHRLDSVGLDVKQCLPPPRDWTEREERRRTFWMAFCEDRYASIGTGWPMTIDEKDILTDLPASDEGFNFSKPERTQSLNEAMTPPGASKLSAFAGVVLMACLFGRNLIHLHRPDADDRDNDLNGEFWKRHRYMDNILLNTALSMPSHLKLPSGLSNPNIVFTNMNIHSSTICLHQAAIYKAEKNRLPVSVSAESKVRCISAANEIASIMRMISHMDLSSMNPFISFCLYVAARVFVQYLKSRPKDSQTGDSLRFLLSAMNALKRKNPLTESFLVQLDVDLESLGMRDPIWNSAAQTRDDVSKSQYSKASGEVQSNPRTGCIIQKTFSKDIILVDDVSPRAAAESGGFHRESNSPAQTPAAPSSDTFNSNFSGERSNWLPIQEHPQSTGPISKIQGLVIGNANSYGSREPNAYSSSSNHGADSGLSPNTGTSNHPTPNSTTPSDTRPSNIQASRNNSGGNSYETSPTAPNQNRLPANDGRIMSNFFSTHPDYNGITTTGMTPDNTFNMPETPERDFTVPNGWDMNAQTSTGLTPVGEGVFRHLMGLGPMDPMDIWEGTS